MIKPARWTSEPDEMGNVRTLPACQAKSPPARRGFTLVELIVSIAMFSIIAIALQSAVLLASKAIPDARGPNVSYLLAADAIERINSELSFALSVSELTATAVTFSVADRDNDGLNETIRYAWSGLNGDPLTRSFNAGPAVPVLDDVREFALAYDRRSQLNPATYTESAETQLFSFNGGFLPVANNIDQNNWVGQYFVANLPNDAVSWRVTRVRLTAQKHGGSDGAALVQVRTATPAGLPTGVVVDQTLLLESAINGSFSARDFHFTNTAAGLDPAAGACIVVRWARDAEACDILSKTLTLMGGPKMVATSNAGASWSGNLLSAMPMVVWGKISRKNADTYAHILTGVRMSVRSGADPAGRASAATRVLAQPQVSAP